MEASPSTFWNTGVLFFLFFFQQKLFQKCVFVDGKQHLGYELTMLSELQLYFS